MLSLSIFRRLFHSSSLRLKICRMAVYPDAHYRHKEGCDTFDFCFFFEHSTLNVSRNFNFSRRITETVGEFHHRVLVNLEKTLSKKKKKKKNKNNEEPEADEPTVEVVFRLDGEDVEASNNCVEVLSSKKATMHVMGQEFRVLVNAPVITSLTLPESMLSGFPASPNKLDVDFGEKKDCVVTWYKSIQKITEDVQNKELLPFEEVGKGFSFTPGPELVDHLIKVKCEPINGELKGPAIETIAKNVISAGPGHCPFDTRHQFTSEYLSGPRFRLMSYNLLADYYADSDYSREVLFPYCPPYALAIDYRKQLLIKEIAGYKADLICLQEVDSKVFLNDLEPILTNSGYSGLFSKKGGQVVEGIACFFKNSTFKFESQECFTLSPEIESNPLFENILSAISKNEALKTRMIERGTILQTIVLRHISTGHLFVVGTTHLYFHPDADHIRLLQAAASLSFLQHKHKTLKENNEKCSLIFCGDFNSTPGFGVYKLMTEGIIPKDYADWKSKETEAVEGLELDHSMKLSSACGCPKYTNFTVGFADCLDYIFYQTDHLKVSQVVPLPSEEELRQFSAIPSVVQPSDHVALVADFEITLD